MKRAVALAVVLLGVISTRFVDAKVEGDVIAPPGGLSGSDMTASLSWNGLSQNRMTANSVPWNGVAWNGTAWNSVPANGGPAAERTAQLRGMALKPFVVPQ